MEIRVALEALVSENFHHLLEREFAFDIFRRSRGLDGVVGTFRYGVEKPVYLLFFRRRVEGVVVRDLGDEFFKQIDMGGDVGPINMPDVFNCCFEGLASLF